MDLNYGLWRAVGKRMEPGRVAEGDPLLLRKAALLEPDHGPLQSTVTNRKLLTRSTKGAGLGVRPAENDAKVDGDAGPARCPRRHEREPDFDAILVAADP